MHKSIFAAVIHYNEILISLFLCMWTTTTTTAAATATTYYIFLPALSVVQESYTLKTVFTEYLSTVQYKSEQNIYC